MRRYASSETAFDDKASLVRPRAMPHDDPWNDDGGGRRLSCFFCGPFDLDYAFYGTKCESTSCGVSICNTDAAPARRISVVAAVAALVSVLIA